MPGVAVTFDVQIALPAEEREVEEVRGGPRMRRLWATQGNVVLLLRPQPLALQCQEQALFDGSSGEQLIDLHGSGETLIGCGDEEQPPSFPARDRLWKRYEGAKAEYVVQVMTADVISFFRQQFRAGQAFVSDDRRAIADAPSIAAERVGLIEGQAAKTGEIAEAVDGRARADAVPTPVASPFQVTRLRPEGNEDIPYCLWFDSNRAHCWQVQHRLLVFLPPADCGSGSWQRQTIPSLPHTNFSLDVFL
jgi:hypothetical protein